MMRCWGLLIAWGLSWVAVAADRTPAPLPAEKAARQSVLPDGFTMTVFAAEPDVTQPISFTIDAKGRLWVAEATNYGQWKPTGKDRVVILEEHHGKLRRTLFYEGFNYITGIEVGFGGVYVMSPPCLYFVPDRNGDDRPDGEPEVLFDGFGYKESRHNLANGFTWGPDGWLYGGHGRTSPSDVGRPGTPADQRIHCDGGVYRIHPTRLVFENFADGTTNPWGVDFDDYGACFVSNCVNPHLFHMLQGGHYEPWRNRPSSQYAYERLPTIADHLHYPGGDLRGDLGKPDTLAMGGGHAHCGTLVYLGDSFPARYRNTVFMCNVHGRRINHDILKRKGSGYTASHAPDFMISADPWFMGVTLRTGPDGSVFVSDWSDTGECHTYQPDTSTGRIYKIRYTGAKPRDFPPDLNQLHDAELVQLQTHPNDFFVRHARRILQERCATRDAKANTAVHHALDRAVDTHTDVRHRLRALWALHATGGTTPQRLAGLLADPSEYLRAWAIQLLCERDTPTDDILAQFATLAKTDPSPLVRLYLASALQRLPVEKRWPILEQLLRHADDATDANIPLMLWYAIEPAVPTDPARALALAVSGRLPRVRAFIARRAAEHAVSQGAKANFTSLMTVLKIADDAVQRDLLDGTLTGLRGQKNLPMPPEWPATYARLRGHSDAVIREHAVRLALIFGDPQAVNDLVRLVKNTAAAPAQRVAAIAALVEYQAQDFDRVLHEQLTDTATRQAAIRGLAAYTHPDTPQKLLAVYPQLTSEEKQDAIATLSARAEYALALLEAVAANKLPRRDISAFAARQMFALNNAQLTDRLKAVWGEVRTTAADKQKLIARYKNQLTEAVLKNANRANGRLLFMQHCQQCHKLFGEGHTIGPDLTGGNRHNLDYLLANLVDPSAEVGRDFRMSVVRTVDERTITGLLVERTAARLVIQTATDKIVVAARDVASVTDSPLSIMPEGLLEKLTREEVRDLIAYLQSPVQVELPPR
ncbi:MAG: c-type cytochrome [Gemmataceae bacterium]|nr:c-type cytochrome [Gemmata sp.]MDW8196282.1 c-type cytochrome [Gemmataceae bacterium]